MLVRCLVVSAVVASGCGTNNLDPGDEPLGGSRTVHGSVVDFQSGMPVTVMGVSVSGVPNAMATPDGSNFTITQIPDNSVFQIGVYAPPDHRLTIGESVTVLDADLDGVKTSVVAEAYLSTLFTAFGVAPSTQGVLFVQLVDANGAPRGGIAGSNLVLAGANGPHFLDGNLMPAAGTSSSSSGWAVFFNVPKGVATLGQAANATVTIDMPASPIDTNTVTLAAAKTTDGAPMVPKNVSFAQQIVPIFTARGCVACHSGNKPGADLGGLSLNAGADKVFKELVQETTTRVVVSAPATSRVLTMPSRETPPDAHPNVTFASPQDPDYVKILVWITEGAKNN
jgi:hypothetical protein